MSGFGKKIVESWNDWQLIVLVLLSLLVQLLLLGTASLRKHTQPRRWRKIYFWALYVGSKYIITYPLGILSRASTSEPNADIQALWAALLLFHLGGPDDFTALSLEDNKIWHRQCFELSIRALTTAYVFSRYVVDRNFGRFIGPFLLISLAGVLKCAEQVYALKEATMEALIKPVLGKPDAGPDYADTMDRVDGMLRSGVLPFMNIDNKRLGRPNTDARQAGGSTAGQNVADARMANGSTAGQNVADARMANGSTAGQNVADARMTNGLTAGQNAADARMANGPTTSQNAAEMTQQEAMRIISRAYKLFLRFKVLFADGIFSFEDRQEGQAVFSGKDAKWAFKVIEIELNFVYDRLYTKASVSRTTIGMMIRVTSLALTIAGSLYALFTTIHATQYQLRHRCVTYTLLAGAVLTEAVILVHYIYSIWSVAQGGWLGCCSVNLVNRRRWSEYMAQSNLITFCLQKLPSDSELHAFLVAFSRRRRPEAPGISASGINWFFEVLHRALPRRWYVLGAMGPHAQAVGIVGAAVMEYSSAAVREYLQRRPMREQLRSKSFWNKYKKTRYVPLQEKHKAFIFHQVKEKEAIFNQREEETQTTATPDRRTPFTEFLQKNKPFTDCSGDRVLEWSFEGKDFDESLLLWHIATDLCFRQEDNQANESTRQTVILRVVSPGNNSTGQPVTQEANLRIDSIKQLRDTASEISNYLLYIMVVHPLMLSSSTTMAAKRCRDTCADARRHFLNEHIRAKCTGGNSAVNEKNAHDYLLKVDTPLRSSMVKGDKSKSVLWDGCFLAKELNKITDEVEKWQFICRVWVEMLCYAAVECGGYQHAERLREGGELITFVCLLMTHLGMGKHYRTEVGDAYARLTPFTSQARGMQ